VTDLQDEILRQWRDALFGEYPEESARFLSKQTDRFRNPVGDVVSRGLQSAAEYLFGKEPDTHDLAGFDELIKVRSVQDFSPAQAIGFVFKLRSILRQVQADRRGDCELADDLQLRIDRLALHAINSYSRCRDEMGEIRVREMERRVFMLMKRMHNRETDNGVIEKNRQDNDTDQKRGMTT
jgi:hypothetical protein